jgi:hypothetical protein
MVRVSDMWRLCMLAVLPMLSGCYVVSEPVLDASTAMPLPALADGIYCHAENKLDPPVVGIDPTISESLGANRCRDLRWLADEARYSDALSPGMVFRTADIGVPGLYLLQVQTGPTAAARLAPIAAVDGLFVVFDPMGEWPRERVEAAGLSLSTDGVLQSSPEAAADLLKLVWSDALEGFRRDITLMEADGGPSLRFADVATAYGYIVYFREDWGGRRDKMGPALEQLAELLGLERDSEP